MKNIFKTFISCIVLAVGVTSCYDEMDSKSSIDAQYDQASNITASLGESTVLSFSEISINGSISSTEGVLDSWCLPLLILQVIILIKLVKLQALLIVSSII